MQRMRQHKLGSFLFQKRYYLGLFLQEGWVTRAVVKAPKLFKGNQQSIEVKMLCQRPIHTHEGKSVLQQISSEKRQDSSFFFRKPQITYFIQLPKAFYRVLKVSCKAPCRGFGRFFYALFQGYNPTQRIIQALNNQGFNLNEWFWDYQTLSKKDAYYLVVLIKKQDLYQLVPELLNNKNSGYKFTYLDEQNVPQAVLTSSQGHANSRAIHMKHQTLIGNWQAAYHAVTLTQLKGF